MDDIPPRQNVEGEGRPPWDNPRYTYKDGETSKNMGSRYPLEKTFSSSMLILERSLPQVWNEEINIWE